MAKSNLKPVENVDIQPSNCLVFSRKIGEKKETGFVGYKDWRVIPVPLVHEILGVDAEVKWNDPVRRGDYPSKDKLSDTDKTASYPDNPILDALQECVNQYVDRAYRTKQSIAPDKLVAGFVPKLTDDGLISDGASLAKYVAESRKPITRAPSVKRQLVSALRGFVEEICAHKGLDLKIRAYVYNVFDVPSPIDELQRAKLDNWIRDFRESLAYKPEFDIAIESGLAELDEVRRLDELARQQEETDY